MHEQADLYWRLRPVCPTPTEDMCPCPSGTAILLRDELSDYPLFCLDCKREVAPERLGFDARLAEDIAHWLSVYDFLYRLWLDSGAYEAWAAARLSDPRGQVNTDGRAIVERINAHNPAYYWWFIDPETAEAQSLAVCPICAGSLGDMTGHRLQVCAACRILF